MSDQQPPPDPYQPYQPYPEDSARREAEQYGQQAMMERPPSIRYAVWLMWAGAALAAIYVLVTLAMLGGLKDDIREDMINNGDSFTQSDVDTAYNIAIVFLIVVGVLGIGLWVWMAVMNSRGRRWARVVATVLAALNILFSLISLLGSSASTESSAAGQIYTIANLLIAVIALFFMYRKDASAYYAAMSRR